MRLILEIRSGPAAGRKIVVEPGHSVTVGRTSRAELVFPDDSHMSSLHFAAALGDNGCLLRDLKSTNGTFLNGARVGTAPLSHGDTVEAGETTFLVHIADRVSEPSGVPALGAPAKVKPEARLLSLLRKELQPLYAVLDAAVEPNVLKVLYETKPQCQSLFDGPQGAQLTHFAPYLVRLPADSPLLEILATKAWGKHWGVYLTCAADFEEVRTQLRRYLMAQLPDGKQVYFRFYDPRVLRIYLPTCTPDEAKHFFGPVKFYLMEDEKPDKLLLFASTEDGAAKKSISLLTPEPAGDQTMVSGIHEKTIPLPEKAGAEPEG